MCFLAYVAGPCNLAGLRIEGDLPRAKDQLASRCHHGLRIRSDGFGCVFCRDDLDQHTQTIAPFARACQPEALGYTFPR